MVRLTDRPDMTLDVYRGRKTTMQQQQSTLFANATTYNFVISTLTVIGRTCCHVTILGSYGIWKNVGPQS